jgi:hypothetical protein
MYPPDLPAGGRGQVVDVLRAFVVLWPLPCVDTGLQGGGKGLEVGVLDHFLGVQHAGGRYEFFAADGLGDRPVGRSAACRCPRSGAGGVVRGGCGGCRRGAGRAGRV